MKVLAFKRTTKPIKRPENSSVNMSRVLTTHTYISILTQVEIFACHFLYVSTGHKPKFFLRDFHYSYVQDAENVYLEF